MLLNLLRMQSDWNRSCANMLEMDGANAPFQTDLKFFFVTFSSNSSYLVRTLYCLQILWMDLLYVYEKLKSKLMCVTFGKWPVEGGLFFSFFFFTHCHFRKKNASDWPGGKCAQFICCVSLPHRLFYFQKGLTAWYSPMRDFPFSIMYLMNSLQVIKYCAKVCQGLAEIPLTELPFLERSLNGP